MHEEKEEGEDVDHTAEKNFVVDRNIPRLLINLLFSHDRSTERMLHRYNLDIHDVSPQFKRKQWDLSDTQYNKKLDKISAKQFLTELKNYNGLNKRDK